MDIKEMKTKIEKWKWEGLKWKPKTFKEVQDKAREFGLEIKNVDEFYKGYNKFVKEFLWTSKP